MVEGGCPGSSGQGVEEQQPGQQPVEGGCPGNSGQGVEEQQPGRQPVEGGCPGNSGQVIAGPAVERTFFPLMQYIWNTPFLTYSVMYIGSRACNLLLFQENKSRQHLNCARLS